MIFKDRFNISGKGIVLTYELQSGDRFPKVGHRIFHEGHEYEVVGVEFSRHLTAPTSLSRNIGLNVRKIQ